MIETYPWDFNPYTNNINTQTQQRNFLQQIDDFINQKQYVKITLMSWHHIPIKSIEGEIVSGSITKDGASAVRRTCSLQMTVSTEEYDAEDLGMDFAINKKVYVEVGIKNYTDQYPEYPILWFKQGMFVISAITISASSSSQVSVSVQLKDLMCMLNGDVGGKFTATTVLDTVETQAIDGSYITQKVPIVEIITELVNHFGGVPLANIVVEDVPKRIKMIMQWRGANPLYMQKTGDLVNGIYYKTEVDQPSDINNWEQFNTGDDVGYIYTDFTFPNDLTMAVGESVTTALDKIKGLLGNYEYFFDIFGIFHFREIKNYMNTTQASIVATAAEDYLVDITTGKATFNFSDDRNLVSVTSNPQYNNIANDYVVQGMKKGSSSNIKHLVMYHLAIDYKPSIGNIYKDVFVYKSPADDLIKMAFPLHIESKNKLPETGNFNVFYMIGNNENEIYYWAESNEYVKLEPIKYYSPTSSGYKTKDWRTELYLRGMIAKNLGTNINKYYDNLVNGIENNSTIDYNWFSEIYNYGEQQFVDVDLYFTELEAFWPEIYDLEKQCFWAEESDKSVQRNTLTEGDYYLDFIDPSTSGIGQFCINNIGRRTVTVNNEDINCLFQPIFPDIVFINVDDDVETVEELRNECVSAGQPYTQVKGNIYSGLATGGSKQACFDEIKYQLYLHTNYAKTLSLTALPAFYLEPNERCSINDKTTQTYGDYMISSISLPFGPGQNMTVSCSEINLDKYQ